MNQCIVEVPETSLPEGVTPLSVQDVGAQEALAYKWIRSQEAQCDLGEPAIREWIRRHWNGFLRARWMEHLEGRNFWIELDHDDFGLLLRTFNASPLFHEIIDRLKAGQENLNILLWAHHHRIDIGEVIAILEELDINSRRIECELEHRLCRRH